MCSAAGCPTTVWPQSILYLIWFSLLSCDRIRVNGSARPTYCGFASSRV